MLEYSTHTVQFSSVAQSCPTLCDPMNCSTPGLSIHHQLLEFTQSRVHRVSNAIQPSHPLSSPSPPAPNLSQHQIFSFSIIPAKEIPGLISFRMDWLYLLAVQRTLKRLLQHHSSKASVLWCSAFFIVAQRLKHLPGMQETQVRSLDQEDPLEKEMAIHSSILAWKIPWTEKPSRLQPTGSQRVGYD